MNGDRESRPSEPVRPETGPESAVPQISPPKIEHFIGRHPHLHALRRAFDVLLEERPVCVLVRGSAGMGKSALIHHFLMGLRSGERPVVLRGRCAEGSTESYRAFGGLADALSRYLRRLSQDDVETLLPRDIHALARVFPVLARVPAIAAAPRAQEVPDAQELRQRSFAALRQLLWRIAERRPLILAIEDLQWSDMDSVLLLRELTRPPDAPAMLFIGSYRTEDVAVSAPLRALLEGLGSRDQGERGGGSEGAAAVPDRAREDDDADAAGEVERMSPGGALRELLVGPLDPLEAEELALALLFAGDADTRARADAIARSSQGNPRFLGELVRAAPAAAPGGGTPVIVVLDTALWGRLARLPEQAMRLLEVVAVAGEPVEVTVAVRAAKLMPEERSAALTLLLTEDLLLTRRIGDSEIVEASHDSVREVIVGRLDGEQRAARHRRLGRALEALGTADAEALAKHWLGAGETEKAGRFAARAADQAADALAFERAARLYELALTLRATAVDGAPASASGAAGAGEPRLTEVERRTLAVKCADALVNAGKSAEAAKVYASAAEGADPTAAVELRRLAAEQYLRSGHIDEGLGLLRAVLQAVGLSFPATPRRALVSLLLHRVELRLRGLGFRERAEPDVRPEDLARIDACWSVTVGLSGVDMIRSAEFSSRALLLALRAGEPYRIARALAFEASSACLTGRPAAARATELFGVLRGLAERLDSPHILGLSMMVRGMLEAFTIGDWKAAMGWYEKADELLRDRCTGVAWEVVTTQLMTSWARYYRGQIDALARTVPAVLRGAEQRGDLYASAIFSVQSAWVALAADDVAGARRAIAASMSRWTQSGFHLEHFVGILAETYVDRYAGRAGAAMKRMEATWSQMEGSMLLRLQNIRIMGRLERASTAIAAAENASEPGPLIQMALRDAEVIAQEKTPWSDPFVPLLRAGAAELRGDRGSAVALLDDAARVFEAVDMGLYAAAARRQAGELLSGEKGLQRILVADAFMARQSIKNPARWAAMLAPGFGRRG